MNNTFLTFVHREYLKRGSNALFGRLFQALRQHHFLDLYAVTLRCFLLCCAAIMRQPNLTDSADKQLRRRALLLYCGFFLFKSIVHRYLIILRLLSVVESKLNLAKANSINMCGSMLDINSLELLAHMVSGKFRLASFVFTKLYPYAQEYVRTCQKVRLG